jgi:hypothetical protein
VGGKIEMVGGNYTVQMNSDVPKYLPEKLSAQYMAHKRIKVE